VNIDPLSGQSSEGIGKITRRFGKPSTSGGAGAGAHDDSELDLITRQNLLDQVRDLPEVRADVAQMGRTLANDPNYPSDEAVEKLATLMAGMDTDWTAALGDDGDVPEEPAR
jgi:hypothetical protein